MGPQFLVDKSSLQSLSDREALIFGMYHSIVVPPVLMSEILADLSKGRKTKKARGSRLRNEAVELARKLQSVGSRYYNLDERHLNLVNLLGEPVALDGRPRVGATPVTLESGESGAVADSAQEDALHEWSQGRFSDGDRFTAKLWRDSISEMDLNRFQKNVIKKTGKLQITDMADLVSRVDELLDDPRLQRDFLAFMFGWANADSQLIAQGYTSVVSLK